MAGSTPGVCRNGKRSRSVQDCQFLSLFLSTSRWASLAEVRQAFGNLYSRQFVKERLEKGEWEQHAHQ